MNQIRLRPKAKPSMHDLGDDTNSFLIIFRSTLTEYSRLHEQRQHVWEDLAKLAGQSTDIYIYSAELEALPEVNCFV
ncbi:hypothetical protein DITRI_Ditri11bG0131500 [Diplodiscus trichospermus]